jgi:hypothetical protein
MNYFAAANAAASRKLQEATNKSASADISPAKAAELEVLVARQALLIETLARLLMAKGVVQERELDEWLSWVDKLDGSADGKLRVPRTPTMCPSCNRANPPTIGKCMYCGTEFPQRFLADIPTEGG